MKYLPTQKQGKPKLYYILKTSISLFKVFVDFLQYIFQEALAS